MQIERILNIIEALLMSANKSIRIEKIQQILNTYYEGDNKTLSTQQINEYLLQLSQRYQKTSLQLVQTGLGYRLQVSSHYSFWVSLLLAEKPQKYSRALLETLALIAYKQPITRGEIEDVRGVVVSSQIMKTLTEREWIRIIGHREVPGKPALYATTKSFLDYFSLTKLDDLPALDSLLDFDNIKPCNLEN